LDLRPTAVSELHWRPPTKDAEALLGRGYARLKDHQYDAAIVDLTAAIALNPKDALACNFRASAYAEKKDFKRANTDEAKARELDRMVRCHRRSLDRSNQCCRSSTRR
jgi:Flp pilus assembly protein TadD